MWTGGFSISDRGWSSDCTAVSRLSMNMCIDTGWVQRINALCAVCEKSAITARGTMAYRSEVYLTSKSFPVSQEDQVSLSSTVFILDIASSILSLTKESLKWWG